MDLDFADIESKVQWVVGSRWGSSSDCVRLICVRDVNRAPFCLIIDEAENAGLWIDWLWLGVGDELQVEITRGLRCVDSDGVSVGGAEDMERERNGNRK